MKAQRYCLVLTAILVTVSTVYGAYDAVTFPGSQKEGELTYDAEWCIWIPDGVKTLRGVVVHQHGCGTGSCDSGRTAVDDLHWQTLARKHDCALIGVSYRQNGNCELWCHPQKGSAKSFLAALDYFAKKNGHPEMTVVPWAIWGHSGGGHWCGSMVQLYPDRIVCAWLRSGHPDCVGETFSDLPLIKAALQTPVVLNMGIREKSESKLTKGIWERSIPYIDAMRSKDAKIAVLVDPLTGHGCGNSRYPAIRFLDECMTARLPETAGSAKLAPMAGIVKTKEQLTDMNLDDYNRKGMWYPSEGFCECCRAYSKTGGVSDTTPPPAPKNVKWNPVTKTLVWECDADFESGLAGFRILRDGTEIATLPGKIGKKLPLTPFQGMGYSDTPVPPIAKMEYVDASAPEGKHEYKVVSINAAGLECDR